jgi:hypothetical protein
LQLEAAPQEKSQLRRALRLLLRGSKNAAAALGARQTFPSVEGRRGFQ